MIKSMIRNNHKFFIISVTTSLVASLAPIFATKDLETEILRNGKIFQAARNSAWRLPAV